MTQSIESNNGAVYNFTDLEVIFFVDFLYFMDESFQVKIDKKNQIK